MLRVSKVNMVKCNIGVKDKSAAHLYLYAASPLFEVRIVCLRERLILLNFTLILQLS